MEFVFKIDGMKMKEYRKIAKAINTGDDEVFDPFIEAHATADGVPVIIQDLEIEDYVQLLVDFNEVMTAKFQPKGKVS